MKLPSKVVPIHTTIKLMSEPLMETKMTPNYELSAVNQRSTNKEENGAGEIFFVIVETAEEFILANLLIAEVF